MNKTIFSVVVMTAIFVTTKLPAQVQGLYSNVETWAEKPVLHAMPENFNKQSAVYLMDSRTFHYKFENKQFLQFNYVYRLVKVQDDKGIEMFNKIYLPVSGNTEIYDIKARVITSTGKVINVPASKIKQEEEDGRTYKLFAMEGIDKGAEIEYSYRVKQNADFFGSEVYHSKSVPYHQAKLLVITPKHLKFAAKGFNGFTVLQDSVIGEERMIPGFSENIKELDDEKYGLRDAYLQRADFKLSYNLSVNEGVEMYTWKELAKKAYGNVTTFSEKEKKAIAKFVASANIPSDATEEKTIMLLEDYMKTVINVDEKLVSEGADNLEFITRNGNTNHFGSVRFFVAMLEHKQIKYQLVFPSIRDQVPLDEELANWNRIDETLIFFPQTGKLVQPSSAVLRYPFVEPYWAGTRGLFLKGTTIGEIKTAYGKFEDVPIEPLEKSSTNIEVHVKFDKTGDSLLIESKQILTGYSAIQYRPIWKYLAKDKQLETMKEIIQSVAKSQNIQDIKAENTALTDCWDNKPLIIRGTIHTAELLENAGKKVLFKIGELIGSQVQMYQEKPRQLPAEVEYAHLLERKITFEIPAGYTIRNLPDIIIDVQHKKDNRVTMGFVSSYTLNNNLLEVKVVETYGDLKYPISEFETFKKVINAAADFNKIVLVLEKT